MPKYPRFPRFLTSHDWSTVVGQHQNWISSRAVKRVIFSLLHAQFTRFLSISLIIVICFSHFYPHKMFTRQPPYEGNSNAIDRSKPPARIGLLMREEWNELWEILEDCWSTDPLDRPTASELEARLRKTFQPLALDIRETRLVGNGRNFMEWYRFWHRNFRIIWKIFENLCRLLMFFYFVKFLYYYILFL